MIDLLTEATVKTGQKYDSWRDCVKDCGQLLIDQELIENEYVESMIQTVEKFGPYMILLPKIAFFHGEPGRGVNKPCLSLVVLEEDLVFKEFGNQVISSAFAFGATDKDSHLSMLKDLTVLLQDQQFVEMLRNNRSKEVILNRIKEISKEKR